MVSNTQTSCNACSRVCFFYVATVMLLNFSFRPDMSLSKDLTDQFKERMAQTHDAADLEISFIVMVLGTNFWPLTAPTHDFTIPREIQPTYERFTRYYQAKHSGRKLTWLWNYGKNELRTNYLNQKYILMTSSYQMAVLVLYNDHDTLSLDEILTATAISKEILSQVLGLLTKAKILISDDSDQYDLNPSIYFFHLQFESPSLYMIRFRFQVEEDSRQP